MHLSCSSLRVFNVSHPSWFIRKNVFDNMGGYDEKLLYIADCDFILQCIRSHKVFKYVNQTFSKFTLHGENASRSKKAKRELNEYFIKMHGPAAYKRFYGNILLACLYARDIRYFTYRLKHFAFNLRHIRQLSGSSNTPADRTGRRCLQEPGARCQRFWHLSLPI